MKTKFTEKTTFASGMTRDTTEGKPAFDLIVPNNVLYEDLLITRWASLMERGARNHGGRNWEQANSQEDLDRFKQSAFRHFMQWFCGETDEDHAAAVLFNLQGAEAVKKWMNDKT